MKKEAIVVSKNKLTEMQNKIEALRGKALQFRGQNGLGLPNLDPKTTEILLDCSGSMSDRVGKFKKWEVVEQVMGDYQKQGFQMTSFDSDFYRGMYFGGGSTDLAKALSVAYGNNRNLKSVFLLSDGLPDSQSEVWKVLKVNIPIYAVYIGRKGDNGEAFMKELAKRTGGEFFTIDVEELLALGQDLKTALQQATTLFLGK